MTHKLIDLTAPGILRVAAVSHGADTMWVVAPTDVSRVFKETLEENSKLIELNAMLNVLISKLNRQIAEQDKHIDALETRVEEQDDELVELADHKEDQLNELRRKADHALTLWHEMEKKHYALIKHIKGILS